MRTPFANEPYTDFTREENREAVRTALERVKSQLDRTYPIAIGEEERGLPDTILSINPAEKMQVIGRCSSATTGDVDGAVAAARRAQLDWAELPISERAAVLFRAARMMRQRKMDLAAWMVLETSKPWAEADADIAEAIDFCEFYGRGALAMHRDRSATLTSYPGTFNQLTWIPLGVGAIIPPWNFPAAILTGMTTAALVCGNAVVLKPSSDSPVIAWQIFEILRAAGVPPGVLNFVTGAGSRIGQALVEHAHVNFVSFTGSKDVGCGIYERAAAVRPGQYHLKRVIAELGGKGSVVVDREVEDLDEIAQAAVASAFGFQGQKCSAGCRLIVHEDVHDAILEKVIARAQQIRVGPPEKPEYNMGAVINQTAFHKITRAIEDGKKTDAKLVLGGEGDDRVGFFIQPTIFDRVRSASRLGQEEIFGPVLSVLTATDFDDLIDLANDTEYGLTGAFYSTDRKHIALAKQRFHVGNLYINRKCTGALVGAEPFGGFKLSGTDSKAGGYYYLQLHAQAKSVSERV